MSASSHLRSGAIAQEAAAWLARRDRGLSAREQDEFLGWLHADGRHAEAFAEHELALRRLMRLGEWQPLQSDEPNPDLFAPQRTPVRAWYRALVFAAAASVVLLAWFSLPPPGSSASRAAPTAQFLRVNERVALPDGSLVELKDGSLLDVQFSTLERRVRLTGEAHFTVARNGAWPFVVEAAGVDIRAVGTAFNVRHDPAATVEVTVTEGKVQVEPTPGHVAEAPRLSGPSPLLQAGQRLVVSLEGAGEVRFSDPAPGELSDLLAWKTPRLQFFETPLAVAVAEMNRHNQTQIVLSGAALGAIPVGGTFRVNNLDGFIRLLEVTLQVRVVSRTANQIVLGRER